MTAWAICAGPPAVHGRISRGARAELVRGTTAATPVTTYYYRPVAGTSILTATSVAAIPVGAIRLGSSTT